MGKNGNLLKEKDKNFKINKIHNELRGLELTRRKSTAFLKEEKCPLRFFDGALLL